MFFNESPPQAILVSDWLISKKNSPLKPAWPNESKLGRKHLCKVLYKDSVNKHGRHRQFLFLIGSFGQAVSEEKIF
jgi:hypothetical protein